MKYDNKNILKLQISTYLEESLSMVGKMMVEDIFNTIELVSDDEATELVEAHYDDNIFEIIAPYLQKAAEEYEIYKRTPEGKLAMDELKELVTKTKEEAIKYGNVKSVKIGNDNEGNGNVH